MDRQAQLTHGLHGAENAGGTAHVVFHFIHGGAGLQRDAAGVEGDALANQGNGALFGRFGALVFHHDDLALAFGPFGHRMEGAHAHFFRLCLAQHFHGEFFVVLGQVAGHAAQVFRVAIVGGQIAQIPGQIDPNTNRLAGFVGLGESGVFFGVPEGQLGQFAGRRRVTAVGVETVGAFFHHPAAFANLPLQCLGQGVIQQPEGLFHRGSGQGLGGFLHQGEPAVVAEWAVTGADQQQTGRIDALRGMQPTQLTFACAEIAGLHELGNVFAGAVWQGLGKVTFLAQQYDQGVCLAFFQGPVAYCEVHAVSRSIKGWGRYSPDK